MTSFRRRLETKGPGDAEQNIFGQIAFGMDNADYVIMRAPKPTLLLSATRDFVDIQGAWHVFREAKRVYTRMGFSERVDLVEADEKHGFFPAVASRYGPLDAALAFEDRRTDHRIRYRNAFGR